MSKKYPAPLACLGRRLGGAVLVAGLVSLVSSSLSAAAPPRSYLVRFKDRLGVNETLHSLEARLGIRARHTYRHAISGFAGELTADQVTALRADPRVAELQLDGYVQLPTLTRQGVVSEAMGRGLKRKQVIPTGIRRCGAALSATARIDGIDDPMNVDVAILDTGIDPRHPDLNVFQSISFAGGRTGDQNGHGTHVAGIIGAKDNTIGVVGVAPGARLWAVRVLNRNGGGSWADIVDGIDWVAARSQQIEVVNISLSGGVDDDNSIIRTAINGLVDAGITVVAAAGNANRQGQQDVSEIIPARYPNVIAVSALADNNGEGGSSSGLFKVAGSYYEFDESLANFSNYGSAMSLIAPGVSILSTYKNRKYAVVSGTSQAAPHVSGAAALYRIMNPEARPQDVRTALRAAGTVFSRSDDPDLVYEPALDVSGL